uniref:Suppressor protein SRP40-like n=1 Tax=Syphacia muris TaxID=451379 RepID=A0A0N5AXP9_9BILA
MALDGSFLCKDKMRRISNTLIVINDDANSGNKEKERDYSQPSSVLTRVRSFLPKIANANRNLPADNTADGFEIINLDNSKNFSNLDCSSESDSSDGEAESTGPFIEMDLSLLKDRSNSSSSSDNSSDVDSDRSDRKNSLPKGFQNKKCYRKRKLVEEVEEKEKTVSE